MLGLPLLLADSLTAANLAALEGLKPEDLKAQQRAANHDESEFAGVYCHPSGQYYCQANVRTKKVKSRVCGKKEAGSILAAELFDLLKIIERGR